MNEEEDESTDDDEEIEELCYAGNNCVGGVVPEVQRIGTDYDEDKKGRCDSTEGTLAAICSEEEEEVESDEEDKDEDFDDELPQGI